MTPRTRPAARALAATSLLLGAGLAAGGCADAEAQAGRGAGAARRTRGRTDPPVGSRLELSAAEWRRRLSPARFRILRERGTEPPFSGALLRDHRPGVFRCAACGAPLFASADRFDSGTGWPSFTRPIAEGRVATEVDRSAGMVRAEIHCARCDGHLGHVFEDGPRPTGLRYCVNSLSLVLDPSGARPR